MPAIAQEVKNIEDIAESLLNKRQQLLIKFCELAGLEPYTQSEPISVELKRFCQLLMDYSALCHFELFEGITNGEYGDEKIRQIVHQVFPKIMQVTNTAVDFNDRYAEAQQTPISKLSNDLSHLGEGLAVCFEIEDKILSMI